MEVSVQSHHIEYLRAAKALAFALLLAIVPTVGSAQTSDSAAARDALSGERELLSGWLVEGRLYYAPVRLNGRVYYSLVSAQDAGRLWAAEFYYLAMTADLAFTADALASFVVEQMDENRLEAAWLNQLIADLDALERDLEDEPADPSASALGEAPPETGARQRDDCVSLVNITRAGALGDRATVTPMAAEHRVEVQGDSTRGWPTDLALSWTRPPTRICVGETHDITLTATNNRPAQDRGLKSAASIGMTVLAPFVTIVCNNPTWFAPQSSAVVAPSESEYVNRCTVTLAKMPSVGETWQPLFRIGIYAVPLRGDLVYDYR